MTVYFCVTREQLGSWEQTGALERKLRRYRVSWGAIELAEEL